MFHSYGAFSQTVIITGCALARKGRKPRKGDIGIHPPGASTWERGKERSRMIVLRSQPQKILRNHVLWEKDYRVSVMEVKLTDDLKRLT